MLMSNTKSNKTPYTVENLEAFGQIAQLRRIIRSRKDSRDMSSRLKFYNQRDTYIRLAISHAMNARYNLRRLKRLGREINQMFDIAMAPNEVEMIVAETIAETLAEKKVSEMFAEEQGVELKATTADRIHSLMEELNITEEESQMLEHRESSVEDLMSVI